MAGKLVVLNKGEQAVALDPRSATPLVVRQAGPRAEERFYEFFAASIRNPNTRMAYLRAARKFFRWLEPKTVPLAGVRPLHVAAYIEQLGREVSVPTVKQNLAAVRMLFDYLVVGQVVEMNPAAAVRGPSYSAKKGKTPVLDAGEARQLLDAIDTSTVVGLRDRTVIALMVYTSPGSGRWWP